MHHRDFHRCDEAAKFFSRMTRANPTARENQGALCAAISVSKRSINAALDDWRWAEVQPSRRFSRDFSALHIHWNINEHGPGRPVSANSKA